MEHTLANATFDTLASGANHRSIKRLVHVRLGKGDAILEAAWYSQAKKKSKYLLFLSKGDVILEAAWYRLGWFRLNSLGLGTREYLARVSTWCAQPLEPGSTP